MCSSTTRRFFGTPKGLFTHMSKPSQNYCQRNLLDSNQFTWSVARERSRDHCGLLIFRDNHFDRTLLSFQKVSHQKFILSKWIREFSCFKTIIMASFFNNLKRGLIMQGKNSNFLYFEVWNQYFSRHFHKTIIHLFPKPPKSTIFFWL